MNEAYNSRYCYDTHFSFNNLSWYYECMDLGVMMIILAFLIGLMAGGSFGYILAALMNIRGRDNEES